MFCPVLKFSDCFSYELFDSKYLMAGIQTLHCQLFTLGPHYNYIVTAGGDLCSGLFAAIREEKGTYLGPMNLSTETET